MCIRDREKAADLMNFQDMTQVKGRSGTWLATLSLEKAMSQVQKAIGKAQGILAAAPKGTFHDEMRMNDLRLRALLCVVRNLHNACAYQGVLDRTDYAVTPPLEECYWDGATCAATSCEPLRGRRSTTATNWRT